VDHFSTTFLGPVEEEYAEDDDGLGYYDDGVKRTLTDAQIAIFRHSEIQALLRERRHAREAGEDLTEQTSKPTSSQGGSEEGELEVENTNGSSAALPMSDEQHLSRKGRKAQQAKQNGYFKQKIKPDLRKRTWDKVDAGMDNLDYGDESSAAPATNPVPQRRKISYED
jgi:Protein of unknown function (DUF3807)